MTQSEEEKKKSLSYKNEDLDVNALKARNWRVGRQEGPWGLTGQFSQNNALQVQ